MRKSVVDISYNNRLVSLWSP